MSYIKKVIMGMMLLVLLTSCQKTLQNEKEVFQSTFDIIDPLNTTGLTLSSYNGNNVAGFYNNGEFSVNLSNLAAHDFIKISFNLYIHDFWDGNSTGNSEVVTGPDIWRMEVDNEQIINTTFSNTVCNEIYCLLQSFPKNYPWQFNPHTGVANQNLPGRCAAGGGITSLYRIEKLVKHNGGRVSLRFSDLLKQSNVPDQTCDESWSLDDLKISTLSSQ